VTKPVEPVQRLALRPKEAAQALGLSERKLRELVPELPHVRRGGVLMFPVEALRRWLEEEAQKGTPSVEAVVDEVLDAVRKD
jgi:excisionase family DNA binding protein